MKTYYELLKIPPRDLTDEERKQLNRCNAIPPSVRKIIEARRSQLQEKILSEEQPLAELIKTEREMDELWDYLNGAYVPEETYYA